MLYGMVKRYSVGDFDALPEPTVNEERVVNDLDYGMAFEFVIRQEGGSLEFDETKFVTSRQYRNAVNLLVYPNLPSFCVLKKEDRVVIDGVARTFSEEHVEKAERELCELTDKEGSIIMSMLIDQSNQANQAIERLIFGSSDGVA